MSVTCPVLTQKLEKHTTFILRGEVTHAPGRAIWRSKGQRSRSLQAEKGQAEYRIGPLSCTYLFRYGKSMDLWVALTCLNVANQWIFTVIGYECCHHALRWDKSCLLFWAHIYVSKGKGTENEMAFVHKYSTSEITACYLMTNVNLNLTLTRCSN